MNKLALSISVALAAIAQPALAGISEGTLSLNANLRYEGVFQDNALKDANALTLRTRLGYTTADYQGLSATVSFEDVRALVDNYNAAGLNGKPTYSVVADPEVTELDLAMLQYKGSNYVAKIGRQVIAWDGQRFVGHVGWRQDRQTFDALALDFMPMDKLTLKYAYIDKRNRIFAEAKDVNSSDHLLNASYKTAFGTVTGYAYLLDDQDADVQIDTYGVSLTGAKQLDSVKLLYTAEFATQDKDAYTATYSLLEAGAAIAGITYKVGYELLGSDEGQYGFSTPLATGHKFNGWADMFLNTPKEGLQDIYVSASGKAFGGSWIATYHDFSADDASASMDSYGSELDLQYGYSFSKEYTAGVKLAMYSADDVGVDTDKVWVWLTAAF